MARTYEISLDTFSSGMSNDSREQDTSKAELISNFDIFSQPKRLTPVRSLIADTHDGSTATGMKQYNLRTFDVINGVNNIYGLGTKAAGTGFKLFKKTSPTATSWSAVGSEGTDTVWAGLLQPAVGASQFNYFAVSDNLRALNYGAGTETVSGPYQFGDTTTSVVQGVTAKDQNAYLGRNNAIYRLTVPGANATLTVTIASPGVFTSTAHGLSAGSVVKFSTTGALPTGLTASTEYYVIATGLTADAFQVSTTLGGSAVNTSGSQSGVHTLVKPPVAVSQVSIPATHRVSSIDNYGNYLAFAAAPKNTDTTSTTKDPVTGASSSAVGSVAWTNPTNILSSNDAYATVTHPNSISVRIAGSGGGGSAAISGQSGAGGGGGYSSKTIGFGSLSASETITVGAAGAAGGDSGAAGGTGGTTSFGSHMTANGGGGGGPSGVAGIGGSASGGDTNTSGTNGATGSSGNVAAGGDCAIAETQYGDGGRGASSASGEAGEQGVVIVTYPTSYGQGTGGTITTVGSDYVHTFTSGGNFVLPTSAAQISYYLKATNFGFVVPVGATINGIKVDVEKKATGTVTDSAVKIVKADGTIGTTNKALGTNWDTVEAYTSYGSSTDLWGETWTYTDINDADFGAVLSATLSAGATASVDHMRITVYYTAAPSSYPNISSYLYIWDLISPDVTEAVDMGPGKLEVIANIGGIILGVSEEYISDSFGNDKGKILIRAWAGGEASILKEIPALSSGGELARWKQIKGGRVYFYAKIPSSLDGSTYREGIWAFGRKDSGSPWALALEYDTSQFASSVQGFRFIGNFLHVAHSTDGSISRSADTEIYTYTSIYQSQVYENNFENQLKSVEITTESLPAGASVVVKIRQDEETAWTTVFTSDTDNSTYEIRNRLTSGEEFAKFHTCQFRLESTGGAVPVKLRARYWKLNDETEDE